MMNRIRQRLFTLHHAYTNPLDAQRAQVLLLLNIVVVIVTLLSLSFLTIPDALNTGSINISGLVSAIVVVVAAAASHQFIQRGRLSLAIWIMLLATSMGIFNAIIFAVNGTPSISTSSIMFLPLPIVVAGVLLKRRGLITITVLTLAVVTGVAIAESMVDRSAAVLPANTVSGNFVAIVISIVSIVVILVTFLSTLQRVASESFEVNKQRQWINLLALELATIDSETDVLSMAIGQARRVFNQRFIEIYLSNEDGHLSNTVTSGQRRMTIRSIDSNIIAEAARSRSLLTTSLADDPSRRTHMAASTSYAAAAPMIVGANMLAVLDFQGSQPFTQTELDTLQQLADQIALALQRVRHANELQTQVLDHEKTIKRLQNQMQDFARSQSQNVSDIWSGYISGRGRQAIGYNLDDASAEPVQATDLPNGLVSTLQSGQMEVATQNGEQIINVPIKFRDTNLGAMSFAVPADQPLSERQLEVATTVAERLALALENTRLFEQSQSQALRERKASEVATALIGATDVRVVLNMAAEQFKDALGAVNTRIYIQPETLMEPLAHTQQEK